MKTWLYAYKIPPVISIYPIEADNDEDEDETDELDLVEILGRQGIEP